jgi:hypothetical protein
VDYGLLADAIVAVHLAYVSFIVVGQLLIVAGVIARWQWIRNFWFRLTHLIAIVIVAFEAIAGIPCPLTVWERQLRVAAGQEASGETFIGRLFHSVLFYRLPSWVFTATYIGFALLVLATFLLTPPRWPRKSKLAA